MKLQNKMVQVAGPYDFELIPRLFLRSIQRQTPYTYLKDSWSSLISINEKDIPVQVLPVKYDNKIFLKIIIYTDVSTKEQIKIIETIQNSFNTNLNLHNFYRHVRDDQKLFHIIKNLQGLKPYFALHPYHSLIRTIIRQLISAQTALNVMSNLVTRLGNSYEFDNRMFYGMPSPDRLARATKNELIGCKVGYKWKLIKQIAQDIVTEDLDLYHLAKKSDEYVMERLKEYSGIGDWTARTFLYDGFGRHEAYSKYDMSVVKAISVLYHSGKQIGESEVDDFFKRYREYHGVVIPYLFGCLWLQRVNHINEK